MLAAKLAGRSLPKPPATTALGALLNHLVTPAKHFQPSNVHFGLMPEPEVRVKKKERKQWYADRARAAFGEWLEGFGERRELKTGEGEAPFEKGASPLPKPHPSPPKTFDLIESLLGGWGIGEDGGGAIDVFS